MARPTKASREAIHSEKGEEGEFEEGGAERNGQVQHLGSDVLNAREDLQKTSTPLEEEDNGNATMGAEHSKEAVHEAIQATSNELLERGQAAKKSTGKLSSVPKKNPAYRNPVVNTTGQRTLPAKEGARQSVYDDIGHSPEKLSPLQRRAQAEQATISPRKSQRKRGVQLAEDATAPEGEEDQTPQRRSQRLGVHQGGSLSDKRRYHSHGRDRGLPVQTVTREAEANNDETSNPVQEGQSTTPHRVTKSSQASAASAGNAKVQGKLGRPPKKRSEGKPGRPRKNSADRPSEHVGSKGATALRDLQKKRRDEDANEEYQLGEEGDAEEIPKDRPAASHRIQTVRPDEMGFSEIVEESPDESRAKEGASKKRKAFGGQKRSKKKRKSNNTDLDEWEADLDPQLDQQRLYKQWLPLKKIFANLADVGCPVRKGERLGKRNVPQDDEQIEALLELCEESAHRFTNLRSGSYIGDAEREPAAVMAEIGERVDGLCGKNEDYPTDFGDQEKVTEIYYHAIPTLVKLARRAVLCYLHMDEDDETSGQITIQHLQNVDHIISLILSLAKAAKKYKPRPDTDLRVIEPVHDGITVPLRDVQHAFAREIHKHYTEANEVKRRERQAQHRALQLEQEERQSRQQDEIRRLQDKWNALHSERMWAEGGLMKPNKRQHLQVPSHPYHFEIDQDGMPFSREEVFVPRVGPPPGLVDEAWDLEWSPDEEFALHDGLMNKTGPMVFERIFREYCGRGRILNRFNVTEIVIRAAEMKERIVAHYENTGEELEEWIRNIPVWTKGRPALGKENEDHSVGRATRVDDGDVI